MEWPEFLESLNSQEPTFDMFGVTPHDNSGITAQPDKWTLEEKEFFENAFSMFNNLGFQTFFEFVASKLPHKSMEEIKNYYITFFQNVEMENPPHNNGVAAAAADDVHDQQLHQVLQEDNSSDKEAILNVVPPLVENSRLRRRRGTPWTESEHQFGKGDWKSISRHYVVSKTPTQVASHAQKYFFRQANKTPVERRRPSINDIQTVTLKLRTTPITTAMTTHQINNNRSAYNNNHLAGSSSMPIHCPNYTLGAPTFSNNFNGNFGRFHQGEASGSNSSVMGQNNNLRRPVSPRPFLSIFLPSTKGNNPQV